MGSLKELESTALDSCMPRGPNLNLHRVLLACQKKLRSSADSLLWARHICGSKDAATRNPEEKPITLMNVSILCDQPVPPPRPDPPVSGCHAFYLLSGIGETVHVLSCACIQIVPTQSTLARNLSDAPCATFATSWKCVRKKRPWTHGLADSRTWRAEEGAA